MTYLLLRTLHILGAMVLFGTGIGIAFFAWFGYRRALRDDSIGLLRGVLALTVIADTVFTATAAVLQPITGFALWHMTLNDWTHPWFLLVMALYVGVGVCWLPVVILQIQLRNAANKAESIAALTPQFHQQFRRWFVLGVPAFVMMLGLLVLMVFRGMML
jgi:uncharacterized membrane protein